MRSFLALIAQLHLARDIYHTQLTTLIVVRRHYVQNDTMR